MFFHTILGNSPFRSRVRRNFTYLQWPAGQRPSFLNSDHVQHIESNDRLWMDDEWGSGEALFARKFSDDRLDLLDRIDSMIRRKEERGQAVGQGGEGPGNATPGPGDICVQQRSVYVFRRGLIR